MELTTKAESILVNSKTQVAFVSAHFRRYGHEKYRARNNNSESSKRVN